MKPYYQRDNITLYCADMRNVELPEADLVLTDPPWAEETHAGARTIKSEGTPDENGVRKFIGDANVQVDFDSITADELHSMLAHIAPVVRRWVIGFIDWRHMRHIEKQPPDGLRFVRFGMWHKTNGAPQFTGDRPATGWEAIAFLHRDGERMQWNGGGKSSVYVYPKVNSNHRTAKPPRLIEQLIKDFSDKGNLILDPFAGGGVVLHTAKLLNRRAVGIEISEARCETIVQWLEQGTLPRVPRGAMADLPLFALEASDEMA